MKRVLYFVEGLSRGGLETFVMNLLEALDTSKVQPSILALKEDKAGADRFFVNMANTLNVPVVFLLDKDYVPNAVKIKRYFDYTKLFKIYVLKYKCKYDIIHIQASNLANMYPYIKIILKHTDWKIIVHSHCSSDESAKIRVFHTLFRGLLPSGRLTLIACSHPAGKWMFGDRKYEIIDNGIPLKKFAFDIDMRSTVRKSLEIKDNEIALCHIGRFDEVKNHRFLIRIFNKFHELHANSKLFLIGDGKTKNDIMQQVKKMNLETKVIFLGVRTDVHDLINGMDCVVFPSFFEGLSITLVEAQANQIPVVASNRVAEESKMCSLFDMLDISENDENIYLWCEKIFEFTQKGRERNSEFARLRDFDINAVARKMKMIYERD